jgi:hypothetical protein
MDLLLERCRDTMSAGRGLIIPLVDDDLISGLKQRAAGEEYPLEASLELAQRRIALTGE